MSCKADLKLLHSCLCEVILALYVNLLLLLHSCDYDLVIFAVFFLS